MGREGMKGHILLSSIKHERDIANRAVLQAYAPHDHANGNGCREGGQ